ncbi:MAG: glutamyl-Q tRNA(Asp) synthetase [Bacteroidales bacterium]|nr:glutamyl-Q tRNA(Asp) synthetase [Candidatus Colicola faecequi]
MHLGNIYSALLSWLSAKQQGGEWILRIEDLDPQRSRMAYALQAEDDLRWLGLTWDRGGTPPSPLKEGDVSYVQSERSAIYEHYLRVLEERGLTYPCYCTRADIMATQAPHESDGRVVYKGTCRPKPLTPTLSPTGGRGVITTDGANPCPSWGKGGAERRDRGFSTRLMVPDREIRFTDQHYGPQTVNLASHCGDFVVRRADGAWAYQLAVVVDDALMGVTEVVRGRDLLLSSAQQIYLYELLGFPVPRFCHLPLLVNEAGQRLSKRDKSLDMGCLRERFSPEELIGILAHAAGQISRPEPISLGELLPLFSWDKVPTDDVLVQL